MYTATTISSLRCRAKAFKHSSRFIMSTWLPSDKHGHRPGARVGLFDGRNDLRGILGLLHPVMLDAHCVQHRFDDLHSVFFGQARRNARLFAQEPHDHANRILSFHRYATQRVHRVQQSRVLHHEHGSMAGGGKAAADGYAFVLFANLHHFEIGIAQDRLQQVVTRDAIGQSDDEANAGLLDFADDVLNPQRTFRHVSSSDVILSRRRNSSAIPGISYATSFTKSASRSPIMIEVKFVFAWLTTGMIEASPTQRFDIPRRRSFSSTTAIESDAGPILHVPTPW